MFTRGPTENELFINAKYQTKRYLKDRSVQSKDDGQSRYRVVIVLMLRMGALSNLMNDQGLTVWELPQQQAINRRSTDEFWTTK